MHAGDPESTLSLMLPALHGICVPLLSPCSADGAADPAALAFNIGRLEAAPIVAHILFGTTGEGPLLSRAERLAYLAAALGHRSRALLAVTTAEGVDAALEEIRLYADAGADAVLALTPRYYPSPVGALLDFYHRLAARSPLPLLAYNMPLRTGVDLGEEGIVQLAGIPGVVGVKDSGSDAARIGRITARVPADWNLLAGSGHDLAGQLEAGASGAVLAVANLAPRLACDVFAANTEGDLERAHRLSDLLSTANAEFVRPGIATLKWLVEQTGLRTGPPRSPIAELEPLARDDVLGRYAHWRDELEGQGLLAGATMHSRVS